MSTMYYCISNSKPIGRVHNKGKDKGYHFTWTMFPYDFCEFATNALYTPAIVDGYGNTMSLDTFGGIIVQATSQSFEEGLE